MGNIDNYIAAIKSFYGKGDTKNALEAIDSLRDFIVGKVSDTLQEEFDRQQKLKDLEDDPVNKPGHYMSYYKDGIECIDAMVAAFGKPAVAHFCACNAFKYLWRHASKNGMQDIEKGMWYLNKYKELDCINMGV